MRSFILLLLLSCASGKPKLVSDDACLKDLMKKKLTAPRGVESAGVYSNLVRVGDLYTGYKIRIVKDRDLCQALVLEYNQSLEPNLYAVSSVFECKEKLSTLAIDTKLGFYSPFSQGVPEDFYFGFDGRVDSANNLVGHISFPENDLADRPTKTRVELKSGPRDLSSMASFDWEIIQRLKLKRACFK